MQHKVKALTAAVMATAAVGLSAPAAAQYSGDVIKIGLITDMSGVYADVDGPGGVEAMKMAIADAGGTINGKKVELISADHLNKADIAASKVREWIDTQGLDMVIGGTNSAVNLAIAKIAAEKKKVFFAVGAASTDLTNKDCTAYTVHYAYDTAALARGTGGAIVKAGGKKWFFLTADYAFGASLEKNTSDVVKANGGTVTGGVKHPLSASDFSSFLLQAQSSGAQILGMANAGTDTDNTIKAANEFGITKSMKLAGLLLFETNIHSLGLELTKGMYLTSAWYWDLNDETRAWSKRFFAARKMEPTYIQAGDYSATLTYLNAVKAAGTDDADKVMEQMKKTKINDMFTKGGVIRPDGRMVHDMYLMQVKTPAESKKPWDYYKVVQTIPGEQAYMTKAESSCPLWK
jgi:branched-chain amino acid transport system substrate-binding protein